MGKAEQTSGSRTRKTRAMAYAPAALWLPLGVLGVGSRSAIAAQAASRHLHAIDKVVEEIGGIRKRAVEFEENPELVRNIVAEGGEKARDAARATLDDVRRAMNLRVD